MQFHIAGMGSVGCLLAFHLRRTLPPEHSITIIHKSMKALKTARESGGIIRVEHQGIPLRVSGFYQQACDPNSEVFPPPEEGSISSASPLLDPSSPNMPPLIDIPEHPQSPPSRSSRIRSLIITTKAPDTLGVVRDLRPRLSPDSTIVLMQNGMGVYEQITHELYPNPDLRPHFIVATNKHGTWIKDYLHIVHAGIGNIQFGIMPDGQGRDFEASGRETISETPSWLNPPRPQRNRLDFKDIADPPSDPYYKHYSSLRNTIMALSNLHGLHTKWKPIWEIQMEMRRKVVVNAVINPITALLGCRNGEIFKHPQGELLAQRVCFEAFRVFHAQWEAERKEAQDSNNVVADSEYPKELTWQSLLADCKDVANSTAYNWSSMAMDVQLARPTELRYITGYLLSLGEQYHVPMLTNTALYYLMRLRSKIPLSGKL